MANPAFISSRVQQFDQAQSSAETITRRGVLGALGFYTLVAGVAGVIGWSLFKPSPTSGIPAGVWVLLIGAFVIAMVVMRKVRLAASLGWVYAVLEGGVLGAISHAYEVVYPGVVTEAIGATVATALVVWFLYGTGIIKVTAKLTRIIICATLGALAFYLVAIVITLVSGTSPLAGGGALGIGISLVLCLIASANLLVDFDQVDRAIAGGVDESARWYFAFGLFVTLAWMFLQMLQLLGLARGGSVRR
jgi:uncharacterized YccA/Bax inhibitor family protein